MSRVRLQLSPSLAASGASCAHLWWPMPASPLQVKQLIREVLNAVGLNTLSLDAIKVTLDGFTVLMNSSTGLLRDGELLEIDFVSNKRKRPQQETAAITPAPKKVVATVDKVPGDAVFVAPLLCETRPSRSARRKAAKRLRKRQGLEISFPANGRRRQQNQQQPKAAAGNGRFKATALEAAKKKKFSLSLSSSSSEEESRDGSSSDGEEDTTSSSTSSSDTDTSSDSDSSASSSSLDEDGDRAQIDRCRGPSEQAFQQDKLNLVFPTLAPCNGMPSVGRVVAYKLLEIGEDYAPRVSEARLGKVVVADTTENVVIIQPYPDSSVHPLHNSNTIKSINKQDENQEEEEVEEEREPPPSNYDEEGILTAELATFSELRYYDASGLDDTNVENKSFERGGEEEELPLGPTNYSRLGPPAAASAPVRDTPHVVIRDPEVLASLVEQLQQRRAEIALAKETPAKANNTGAPSTSEIDKTFETTAGTATAAATPKTDTTNNQKKKNPRHRGALQSAIGPMLRMLRSSEEL